MDRMQRIIIGLLFLVLGTNIYLAYAVHKIHAVASNSAFMATTGAAQAARAASYGATIDDIQGKMMLVHGTCTRCAPAYGGRPDAFRDFAVYSLSYHELMLEGIARALKLDPNSVRKAVDEIMKRSNAPSRPAVRPAPDTRSSPRT